MNLTNLKALSFCCFLGFTLWVATYAVCAIIALDIGLLEVLGMGFEDFLICLVVFCCGGVLVVSGLLFLYALLSLLFPNARGWGEGLFVLAGGLLGLLLALSRTAMEPLDMALSAWLSLCGFFCLPALYTVLCLRGWEYCRRKRVTLHGAGPA